MTRSILFVAIGVLFLAQFSMAQPSWCLKEFLPPTYPIVKDPNQHPKDYLIGLKVGGGIVQFTPSNPNNYLKYANNTLLDIENSHIVVNPDAREFYHFLSGNNDQTFYDIYDLESFVFKKRICVPTTVYFVDAIYDPLFPETIVAFPEELNEDNIFAIDIPTGALKELGSLDAEFVYGESSVAYDLLTHTLYCPKTDPENRNCDFVSYFLSNGTYGKVNPFYCPSGMFGPEIPNGVGFIGPLNSLIFPNGDSSVLNLLSVDGGVLTPVLNLTTLGFKDFRLASTFDPSTSPTSATYFVQVSNDDGTALLSVVLDRNRPPVVKVSQINTSDDLFSRIAFVRLP